MLLQLRVPGGEMLPHFAVLLFFVMGPSLDLNAKTPDLDHQKNIEFQEKCERVREYNVSGRYDVDCFHNYHHYNSKGHEEHYSFFRAKYYGEVRLGSFNLWHPGTSKSGLKDYKLLAKVVDQWDVLSAQELLPVVGEDLRHNQDIQDFIDRGPKLLKELRRDLSSSTGSERRELKKRIELLKKDLKLAPKLFRGPGYLKLLEELRKVDPSWALILAPRGEAAESFHVQELTGFYYRSSRVRPVVNKHCQDFPARELNGKAYACIPNFYRDFMGKNVAKAFSRRPFMASFRSAQFDFSLLSSHVIFTSPGVDDEQMETIMRTAFDRPTYENLGEGFNLGTYARFAEIKLTLDFMQKYNDRYRDSNLIFAGDMNVEASNSYWPEILKSLSGAELFIDEPTSMSQQRYRSDDEPTLGMASNYDHFIFSPKATPQCDGEAATTFNFYTSWLAEWIDEHYIIRNERLKNVPGPDKDDDSYFDGQEPDFEDTIQDFDFSSYDEYDLRPGARAKIQQKIEGYTKRLKQRLTIRDDKVVWDDRRFEQRLQIYQNRIFFDQLENRTYYRIFFELLSDHFPISMNCKNTK